MAYVAKNDWGEKCLVIGSGCVFVVLSISTSRKCSRNRSPYRLLSSTAERYIDYFIESALYGFLFTSCKTLENDRVSAANE